MKNLIKNSILFLFLLVSLFTAPPTVAQDIDIKLQPFTLEIPNVNGLKIRPLGGLVEKKDPSDTTKFLYDQYVYYELTDTLGVIREMGNKYIPDQYSELLMKVKKRTLTPTEKAIVIQVIKGFNPNMEAILPENE